MRLLVILLLVPLAAGGSADDPEVVDPTGDQAGNALGNNHGDIVKAWIEPAGFDGYHAFMQLSALDAQPVRYEFTWRVTNTFDTVARESFRGVMAEFNGDEFDFYYLQGDTRNSMVANRSIEDYDLGGTVLAWDRPLGPTVQQGDQFDDWIVAVHNLDPATRTVIGTFDTALGDRPLVFHTFPPFTIANLTQLPGTPPVKSEGQQELWVERAEGMWQFTMQVPKLDPSGPRCDFSWDLQSGDLSTHVSVRIGDNHLAPLALQIENDQDYPALVALAVGTPGLVQLSIPEEAYVGDIEKDGFASQIACGDGQWAMSQLPSNSGSMRVGWYVVGAGTFLVLVALAVVVRKSRES